MKPTQRMRLFKSEADFSRAIIEMTQQIILLLDTDGAIMDCNVHMARMSGYSAEELNGRQWHEILGPVDGKTIPQGYLRNTIMSCAEPRTEVYRMLNRSGGTAYIEFSFRVVKDAEGAYAGVLVVGYDVTELVQHELSLERERFGLIERNKELSCLYQVANLAHDDEMALDDLMQRVIGLIPDALQYPEIATASIRLDDYVFQSPGYRPSELSVTEPIVIQGDRRGTLEFAYQRATAPFGDTRIAFLDEECHLAHALARQLSLIMEKREADARKAELEQQLRHSERLATIGQLAAGVAHELNEPLGNILGFAQLAGRSPELPPQIAGDLDKIVRSSLHAREIIKKLMLFGRRMPTQVLEISLNKIVEDGLYFLEARCTKRGIAIHKALDADLPAVPADPSQIEQVLVNLVINAIQAMGAGGDLTIRTFAGDGQVCLAVGDTGVGIDDEALDQIFVPFFTTKDVDEGTGLGLSVVHGIVSAHKGQIDVDSRVGQGTTFTIRLPLQA